MKKLNTQIFIERAQQVHGTRYDYSVTKYQLFRKPVSIICKKHGTFHQQPSNHLRGSGCLLCSHDEKKSSTERFIQQCANVHNNRYDYSRTVLTGMNNKVIITCPIHGDFEQRAASHVEGSGCSKCSESHPHTLDTFVKKAIEKHGDRYEYSNVQYRNVKTKVFITCLEHGDFSQTPCDHLHGYGCPSCGGVKPVTKDEFVVRAVAKHGLRYDYSQTLVNGMNTKGTILCSIHGTFEQRLADHLSGSGCPHCALENGGVYTKQFFEENPDRKMDPARFYIAEGTIDEISFCKVGITKQDPNQRLWMKGIKILQQYELSLFDAWCAERHVLTTFKRARFRYKSLKTRGFAGWTECFSKRLLDDIQHSVECHIHGITQ